MCEVGAFRAEGSTALCLRLYRRPRYLTVTFLPITKPSKMFHGTNLAQRLISGIEIKEQFAISLEAHNLKAAGSNPAPATKPRPPIGWPKLSRLPDPCGVDSFEKRPRANGGEAAPRPSSASRRRSAPICDTLQPNRWRGRAPAFRQA
jgi:hypothetical protein